MPPSSFFGVLYFEFSKTQTEAFDASFLASGSLGFLLTTYYVETLRFLMESVPLTPAVSSAINDAAFVMFKRKSLYTETVRADPSAASYVSGHWFSCLLLLQCFTCLLFVQIPKKSLCSSSCLQDGCWEQCTGNTSTTWSQHLVSGALFYHNLALYFLTVWLQQNVIAFIVLDALKHAKDG